MNLCILEVKVTHGATVGQGLGAYCFRLPGARRVGFQGRTLFTGRPGRRPLLPCPTPEPRFRFRAFC